jgi:hypothetical protein
MSGGRDAGIDSRLQKAFAAVRGATPGDHPSEDDWARFAADEMSPDERAGVADHILSCEECAAIFRVVSLVGAGAQGMGAPVDRRPGFGGWRFLAAAAAVVLTLGLGTWWAMRTGIENGIERAVRDAAPRATTRPAVTAPAQQPPSWAALSSAPEVRLPPDLVLTMRGTGDDRDGFLEAFGKAIAPYRAGQFAEAAAALAPVAERYPKVVETWFYLGAARLYGGAASEAIEPLRRAQSSEVVGDEARWLQAVALQRAGRDSEARSTLDALCSAAGQFRDRACAIVKP